MKNQAWTFNLAQTPRSPLGLVFRSFMSFSRKTNVCQTGQMFIFDRFDKTHPVKNEPLKNEPFEIGSRDPILEWFILGCRFPLQIFCRVQSHAERRIRNGDRPILPRPSRPPSFPRPPILHSHRSAAEELRGVVNAPLPSRGY